MYTVTVKHASIRHVVIVCDNNSNNFFFKARKDVQAHIIFLLKLSYLPIIEAPGGPDVNIISLSYSTYFIT